MKGVNGDTAGIGQHFACQRTRFFQVGFSCGCTTFNQQGAQFVVTEQGAFTQQVKQALLHFLCGFAGKGNCQNLIWPRTLEQQAKQARGE